MTKVVNISRKEAFDTYIGRPSIWGNPYSHQEGTLAEHKVATREEAIARYEEWIKTQPDLLALLPTLIGMRLGCWCAPKVCHGDVLVKLVEELEDS